VGEGPGGKGTPPIYRGTVEGRMWGRRGRVYFDVVGEDECGRNDR
jgi:hypothetical protein